MKIAVLGSWKENKKDGWEMKRSEQDFKIACSQLGAKVVQYGHSIIIGSEAHDTADKNVVDGILQEAKNKTFDYPPIMILRPDDTAFPYENEQKNHPNLFTHYPRTQPDWDSAHMFMVKEADAILIIGGKSSSYTTGLATLMGGKRLVPIGSFGGAGEKLLNLIETLGNKDDLEKYRKLHGLWTTTSLESVMSLLKLKEHPRILIIHGRSNDWQDLKDYLQNSLKISEPIIMGQRFGYGMTLPEKFEYLASNVDAAIALATPDDAGALIVDGNEKSIPTDNQILKPRARQNVWLEIGWFWGAFKRGNIMILCRGEIEIPSDVSGIELYLYKDLNP